MSEIKIAFWRERASADEYSPSPAAQELPEWWKKMPAFGGFGGVAPGDRAIMLNGGFDHSTIKRCVPVLDSMSLGYIIKTDADIYVHPGEEKTVIDSSGSAKVFKKITAIYPRFLSSEISLHENGQVETYPGPDGQNLQKIFTPWHVKTPDGYSVIFTEPLNSPSPYWSVLPAIMDTDKFCPRLNFMVYLKDSKFKGIIPAGTPLVQVIPFKRDPWVAEVSIGDKETSEKKGMVDYLLARFFYSSYKKGFWTRKNFK